MSQLPAPNPRDQHQRSTPMKRFLFATAALCLVSTAHAAQVDENCNFMPSGKSWDQIPNAAQVLVESRIQQAACMDALNAKRERNYQTSISKPGDAVPFVLGEVIYFT